MEMALRSLNVQQNVQSFQKTLLSNFAKIIFITPKSDSMANYPRAECCFWINDRWGALSAACCIEHMDVGINSENI